MLHFSLLLQLCLLADKLHRFDHAVAQLPENETRKYYATQLFPFAFSHTLSGRQHSAVLKFLLTVMVWVTVIWLPLSLLIGLQVGFLAYHSEQVLTLQRWAIAIDLVFLTFFWPIIRAPDGKGFSWIMRASGLYSLVSWVQRRFFASLGIRLSAVLGILNPRNGTKPSGRPMIEGSLSLVTLMAVIAFSWGVAVLPDSANEKRVGQWIASIGADSWLSRESSKQDGHRYFRLTERLFDETMADRPFGDYPVFHRNLRLREKLLIANLLAPEDQVALTDEDMKVREQALKKTVGLNLNGRDLRYADFSESVMPKVDLRKADLRNANFEYAILTSAWLTKAQLQAAVLRSTQLQSADLKFTALSGANLQSAKLQGANFYFAVLRGADLSHAQLQSANLGQAGLQGVNLENASLQDANLASAKLQAANLRYSELQGANLQYAQFQGADMQFAKLQGTPISNSISVDSGKFKIGTIDSTTAPIGDDYGMDVFLKSTDLRLDIFKLGELALTNITGINFEELLNQREILRIRLLPEIKKIELPSRLYIDPIDPITLDAAKQIAIDSKFYEPDLPVKHADELVEKRVHPESKPVPFLVNDLKGHNIWAEEPGEFLREIFEKSKGNLTFAKSESDYYNKLTAFRIEISCHDRWVAAGIIKFLAEGSTNSLELYEIDASQPYLHPLAFSFAQCLLTLKNKTNESGQPVCPGVTEINNEALQMLEVMARFTELKNNAIQPTFKCRRMKSYSATMRQYLQNLQKKLR